MDERFREVMLERVNKPLQIPRSDIEIGALLGIGAFSEVFRVELSSYSPGLNAETPFSARTEVGSQYCNRFLVSRHRYALKQLSRETIFHTERKTIAIQDMTHEVEILSTLPSHKNIIRLHAISKNFWESPEHGFMILEALTDTLVSRMAQWKRRRHQMYLDRTWGFSFVIPFRRRHSKIIHRELMEQCSFIARAGLGIARAIEFLHQHNIIYRDLKPQNVGFGVDGKVRLFDFGLARKVLPENSKRRLSGSAGTARYMAPEVSLHESYSFPADVYSFAILLWQICTLEKPFARATTLKRLEKMVTGSDARPSLRKIRSSAIKQLLKASWDRKAELRPNFACIVKELELEISFEED